MKNKIFFILILTYTVNSCVDPYYPEIDKYVNNLAIDGLISNGPGPYFIRIQLSTTIYYPEFQPLSNANVYVTDDLGNVEEFLETEDGVYKNKSPEFKGEFGRSYQLTVSISENQNYQSGWEKIQEPVGIDSVYAKIEEHIDPDKPYGLVGYQFYINTEKSQLDSTFLIWRLQSTYQFNSDFKCRYTYNGKIEPFPNADSLMTCWKTETVPIVLIGSTQNSKNNQLIQYPLHFVSTEGRELSIRYSVLVNQNVVSKEVYNYWKAIQDQNDIQGNLYTQQPHQIRGNIENLNNPEELVAGCFVAAGLAQKRVFYNRPPVKFYYSYCVLGETDFNNMLLLPDTSPSQWPIYITMGTDYALAFPNQECIDCRKSGGKLEKPDFWIDN